MSTRDPLKRAAAKRRYWLAHKEQHYAGTVRCARRNPYPRIFAAKKYWAKKNGVKFTITQGQVVWPEYCPIFGIKINYERYVGGNRADRGGCWDAPSFDRIRPDEGYVLGNVAIISKAANTIKSFGTAEQHRAIADWMDLVSGIMSE